MAVLQAPESKSMNITTLKMEYGFNGEATVSVWVGCNTPADIDELMAWLKMAKYNMASWKSINDKFKKTKLAKTVDAKREG